MTAIGENRIDIKINYCLPLAAPGQIKAF